jgi:RNA-directed DNA polymerase
MIIVHKSYKDLFRIDNILIAWNRFRRGKSNKKDVVFFERHLEDNIFLLHKNLINNEYHHSSYTYFQIFDNKKRDINKAKVKDRIIHQIVYNYLYDIFNPLFISDSYSSRLGKGQYKALLVMKYFIKLSGPDCFVLKCDIKKYFDNIDHKILISFIEKEIKDEKLLKIIEDIIKSFHSKNGENKGIPLGNITSQIFANIYLDSLDKYIKKELKCRFYVRYNDDFVIISKNKKFLENLRNKIISFVLKNLKLEIPLEKTCIRKINWGVDFLGFTILPEAVLLRNKTKQKIYERVNISNINSYLGILKHCNSYNLRKKIVSLDKLS